MISVIITLALPLITQFEGFKNCAYWDHGRHSIGYGTAAKSSWECLDSNEYKAKEKAKQRMVEHVKQDIEYINSLFPSGTPEQKAPLVSLAYNYGRNGIKDVLRLAENKEFYAAAVKIKSLDKGLEGVKLRREKEAELFLAASLPLLEKKKTFAVYAEYS